MLHSERINIQSTVSIQIIGERSQAGERTETGKSEKGAGIGERLLAYCPTSDAEIKKSLCLLEEGTIMTEERRREYESLRASLDKLLPKECGNCETSDGLQIHHIVPLAIGGSNKIANLVRLCNDCHAKAHGGHNFVRVSSDAIRENARKGKPVGGNTPYGYMREGGAWVIDEGSAWVIRFIFRMRYVFEYSTLHIAKVLEHMAIPTARGSRKWSHPVIKRIIDNPQYLGISVLNGEHYGKLIPPIIDGELAEAKYRFAEKYEGSRIRPKEPPLVG